MERKEEYLHAHKVYPNIYVGSITASSDINWLFSQGITHILALINYGVKIPGINYLIFNDVNDTPLQDILSIFPSAFRFINEAISNGGRVLIHCHAGISRSSTVAIGYVMYCADLDLETTLSILKKERAIIHPNYGFMTQLQTWGILTRKEMDELILK